LKDIVANKAPIPPKEVILELKDLKVHFHTRKGIVKAVDGISYRVHKGEILALVGESGCGKSVSSQAILGLIGQKKQEKVSGEVLFKGENLFEKNAEAMRSLRGNRIAMIFQDPMTSLNPLYKVGRQVGEVAEIHQAAKKKTALVRAIEMLKRVGIPSATERAENYPHQFSGGMRQRSIIAMSLMCKPDLLIADEPTTALDVTIQAQILDLLRQLRDETGTAIIFITHDLGVVAELCDSVAVMYAGIIVEQAPMEELFKNPQHPYTKGLLACLPKPGVVERLSTIEGQPPNMLMMPPGCPFAQRCPGKLPICLTKAPALKEINEAHYLSCWLKEGVNNG